MTKPKRKRTPQTVEQLIQIAKWLAFKAWTKTVASRGAYLAPAREDLEGAALLGLAQAIHRFDPQRGLELGTFATPRIRGAIQDEIRRSDMLGRTFRNYRPEAGDTAQQKPRKKKSGVNHAKFVLIPLEERIALGLKDPSSDILTKIQQEEQRRQVQKHLDHLPPRYKEVLWRFYWEDKTTRVIAVEMSLSRTTISALLRKACDALHRLIRQDLYK